MVMGRETARTVCLCERQTDRQTDRAMDGWMDGWENRDKYMRGDENTETERRLWRKDGGSGLQWVPGV